MKLFRFCFSSILVATVSWTTLVSAALPEKSTLSFTPKSGEFYVSEEQKSFPLRSIKSLHVVNRIGSIKLVGWAHDRISVQLKKKVTAESKEEADLLFEKMGVRVTDQAGKIELTALYQAGQNLKSRIDSTSNQNEILDLEISAPSRMLLSVWTKDATVLVDSWKNNVELRGYSGAMTLNDITADQINATCFHCPVSLKKIKGNLRVSTQTEAIHAQDVNSMKAYFESTEGDILLSSFEGNVLLFSKSGNIKGDQLKGSILFKSNSGDIRLTGCDGRISGVSVTGDIHSQFNRVELLDKTFLETQSGNIDLNLPKNASFDLDVSAEKEKLHVGLPLNAIEKSVFENGIYRLKGQLNEGGEDFRIFSVSGVVKINKNGSPL